MPTTAKEILRIYKPIYILSVCFCLCVVISGFITNPMPYVIANMLELINFDVLNAFRGGSDLDPVDFANFKIL